MSVMVARVPALAGFRLHRSVAPAGFEGTPVPGLSARFFHRDEAGRTASVGCYRYAGREVLRAWGWTDETHCAFSAVRGPDDRWGPVTAGCPDVRMVTDAGAVVGLRVGDGHGGWVLCRDDALIRSSPARSGR